MPSASSSELIFPHRYEFVTTTYAFWRHPTLSFPGSKQVPLVHPLSLPACHDRRRNAICRSNNA